LRQKVKSAKYLQDFQPLKGRVWYQCSGSNAPGKYPVRWRLSEKSRFWMSSYCW